MIQLSHLYMTTGKTIALTRQSFVGKVMSLLFNMLTRFVIFSSKNQVSFLFYFIFLFVVNFVIHWNETAMGLHVFPILIPPPTSLSTRSP